MWYEALAVIGLFMVVPAFVGLWFDDSRRRYEEHEAPIALQGDTAPEQPKPERKAA